QVRNRVERRHGAEPVLLDQVPREVHGGQEEPDEEEREEPLHRLAGAGSQREERAERAERDRDSGREDDEDDSADARGLEPNSGDQPDGQVVTVLDEGEHRDPAELPDDQRAAAERRQRESVQEPGLDVAREVRARVHRREERALDEREREEKSEERVRWEAGD